MNESQKQVESQEAAIRESMKDLPFETILKMRASHPELFSSELRKTKPAFQPESSQKFGKKNSSQPLAAPSDSKAPVVRSSLVPPARKKLEAPKPKRRGIDPRFEDTAGPLNRDKFHEAYSFLEPLKAREVGAMAKTLASKKAKRKLTREELLKLKSEKGETQAEINRIRLRKEEQKLRAELRAQGVKKISKREFREKLAQRGPVKRDQKPKPPKTESFGMLRHLEGNSQKRNERPPKK